MTKFLIPVTQTRIVEAEGFTLEDAIKDVEDNPGLYGEEVPSFGEEVMNTTYLDDFTVNKRLAVSLNATPS